MKRQILLTVCTLFIINTVFSQTWNYSKGGDAFDGKYRTSSIEGIGDEFPYQDPSLIVNYFPDDKNLNVYLTDAGYAGCEGKTVKVKFNNDETIYVFNATTNSNEEIWFIHEYPYEYSRSTEVIPVPELLEKMKKYHRMFVRISSDCGTNDLEFSLNGSSKAINFILPDNYFEKYEQKQQELKEIEQIEQSQESSDQKPSNDFNGEYEYKSNTYNFASIYKTPEKNEQINQVEVGDSVYVIDSKTMKIWYRGSYGFMNKGMLKD